MQANAPVHVGTQVFLEEQLYKLGSETGTNNIGLGKLMSVSLERRCKRGGGYRIQAKS